MDEGRLHLVAAVAREFIDVDVEPKIGRLGGGNINDTYLVNALDFSFVLQRINGLVFPRPELVVQNFATVTAHLASRAQEGCLHWQDIHLLPTITGGLYFRDERGDIWRAQSYIDGTTSFPVVDSFQAQQVGWAVGYFHQLLADLPAASLVETLPDFHVLATYLGQFDRVRGSKRVPGSVELDYCLDVVEKYRGRMQTLEWAEAVGRLTPYIIHGDPKAANVLFDPDGRAVSVIDLDTVRPGLLHYDIGDCLRSCCNPGGEHGDLAAVRFEIDWCREILLGYLSGAGSLITSQDKEYIFEAVCLLSFELGLRFLTDYLAGNRYFKIVNEGDNLHRAMVQFHLLNSIRKQERLIRMAVD
jgi:hypothetical protein